MVDNKDAEQETVLFQRRKDNVEHGKTNCELFQFCGSLFSVTPVSLVNTMCRCLP